MTPTAALEGLGATAFEGPAADPPPRVEGGGRNALPKPPPGLGEGLGVEPSRAARLRVVRLGDGCTPPAAAAIPVLPPPPPPRASGLSGEGAPGEKSEDIQSLGRPPPMVVSSPAARSPPGELRAKMVCCISLRLVVSGGSSDTCAIPKGKEGERGGREEVEYGHRQSQIAQHFNKWDATSMDATSMDDTSMYGQCKSNAAQDIKSSAAHHYDLSHSVITWTCSGRPISLISLMAWISLAVRHS